MESSTLFLSNIINLELHGIFAQRDLFPFIWTWTPRDISVFFCQLTIVFIAMLNDNYIALRNISIARLFLF